MTSSGHSGSGKSVQVTTARGARGTLSSLDGETLIALLDRACAPGTPTLFTTDVDEATRIEAKAIRSRRHDAETFEVRLRVINLRREARAALAAALSD